MAVLRAAPRARNTRRAQRTGSSALVRLWVGSHRDPLMSSAPLMTTACRDSSLSETRPSSHSPRRDRFGLASGLCVCLVGMILIEILPRELWESPVAFGVLLIVLLTANARLLPPGALCWPNIFIVLTFLTNISYFFAVELHLIAPISYMPSLDDPGTSTALQIGALAILATEVGVLVALLVLRPASWNRNRSASGLQSPWSGSRLVLWVGIVVTVLAAGLYLYLVVQLGGIKLLSGHEYTQYMNELFSDRPAFGTLGVSYLPTGLLLIYAGIDSRGPLARRHRLLVIGLLGLYALVTLSIGDRNDALLAALGFLYIHNGFVSKFRLRGLALWCVVGALPLLLLLSYIGEVRSGPPVGSPISATTGYEAISSAYWPYIGFIDYSSEYGYSLGSAPYTVAIAHVLPTILSSSRGISSSGFTRSTTFITQWISPADASVNIGLGGSAIGEAYASFGTVSVALQFAILGLLLGGTEIMAVQSRRLSFIVFLILVFIPMLFYLRDDLFGLLRPLVWSTLLAMVVGVAHSVSVRHGDRGVAIPAIKTSTRWHPPAVERGRFGSAGLR